MLNALLDTVNIDINEEGLNILTLDCTHLAFLQQRIVRSLVL
jgi:glutamate racemase